MPELLPWVLDEELGVSTALRSLYKTILYKRHLIHPKGFFTLKVLTKGWALKENFIVSSGRGRFGRLAGSSLFVTETSFY